MVVPQISQARGPEAHCAVYLNNSEARAPGRAPEPSMLPVPIPLPPATSFAKGSCNHPRFVCEIAICRRSLQPPEPEKRRHPVQRHIQRGHYHQRQHCRER
jgi:hypothetical protein